MAAMGTDSVEQVPVPRYVTLLRRHATMVVLTVVVAWLALRVQRNGISWGDDFALYTRQAQSLIDGNIAQVVSDNRFNVLNAAKPGFSPVAYPWGFPLLLAPFVRVFGMDWAALKLAGVLSLLGFLWAFHAVLRRRMTPALAFATVAAVGTTVAYVRHTDSVLSELPYLWAVTVALWWLDRIRRDGTRLHTAPRNELVVLGALMVLVFNVRREGLALVPAVLVAQLADLRGFGVIRNRRTLPWRRIVTPLVTFVVGGVLFQLLLPSALAPEYAEAGLHQTWEKLQGPYRLAFADQWGFPDLHGTWLGLLALLCAVGVIIRMTRAAAVDAPLFVFAAVSVSMAGMIPAISDRYLMGGIPFAVYFAAQAIASLPLGPALRARHAAPWLAVAAMSFVSVHHLTEYPTLIDASDAADRRGVANGPERADVQEAFDAVRIHTHQDDVIAFFKVRALTLYTDRRGVQSSPLAPVQERADYFLMEQGPAANGRLQATGALWVSDTEAADMGWAAVWRSDQWVLWSIPRPVGEPSG